MAFVKSASIFKFVGTLSLGLLTGLSYGLSTTVVPTILSLPSASLAARSFSALTASAGAHLRTFASLSSSAFLVAFWLSPRCQRHPYLVYVSLLTLASTLADRIAPHVPDAMFRLALPVGFPHSSRAATSQTDTLTPAQISAAHQPVRRLDQSYEVLGDGHSDAVSAESPEDVDNEALPVKLNGEEVRVGVDAFLKARVIQTAVSAVSFALAVVGLWGDGVPALVRAETIVFEL